MWFSSTFQTFSVIMCTKLETIERWVCRFQTTANVMCPGKPRIVLTAENIDRVCATVDRSPIIQRAGMPSVSISRESYHHILFKDLGYHSHKLMVTQQLQDSDYYLSCIWFRQDGTTCHCAGIYVYCSSKGVSYTISHGTELVWLPYLPDSTIPDFFLWGIWNHVFAELPRMTWMNCRCT